jgi:uncharacterized OB-fold protein
MNMEVNAAAQSGPEEHYFGRLAQGVFEIQRCTACARHQFFPRILCVHCGSEELEWVAASGRGTVYSYSVVRRKPEAGGDYNVVLVDLDEGVRLMSRLEGVAPDDIRIGQAVRARVAQEDGKGIVVFDPEVSHA